MKHRPRQLSEEIVRLANDLLTTRVEISSGMLITVVGAEMSADLREAVMFISILPESKQGSGLEKIRRILPMLRSVVAKSLSMKHVPVISIRLADQEWHERQNLETPASLEPEQGERDGF